MSSPEKIKKYTTFNIKETNKNGKEVILGAMILVVISKRKDATGTSKK